MKRLPFIFLFLVASMQIFASEDLDLYTWLYDQSATVHEQYAVIKTVSDLKIADAGTLYAGALEKLNTVYPDLSTPSDRNIANALAQLLCVELGLLKYETAASSIWRMSQMTSDPVVKGEAMTAIGRIRAMEFLPQLVDILSDLNLQAPVNRYDAEKVAYGTIMGLEKFRVPEAYEPIFHAANGWYSKPVKDLAKQVLPSLLDDPSPQLKEIIQKATYDIKLVALEASFVSKAPDSSKSALAAYAYMDGWTQVSDKVSEQNLLARYRKASMEQLVSFGVPDEVLPFLDRSYREGLDIEEKLSAIAALAKSSAEQAVVYLAAYLTDMNARRKANVITQTDERIVRAIIPALGRTGKATARKPLAAVEFMGWQPAVVKLAQDALKEIP